MKQIFHHQPDSTHFPASSKTKRFVTTADRLRHPQCLEVCTLPLPVKRRNIPKIASCSPADWGTTKAPPIPVTWMKAHPLTGSKKVLEHLFSSWFFKTSCLTNVKSSFQATGRERIFESTKPRIHVTDHCPVFQLLPNYHTHMAMTALIYLSSRRNSNIKLPFACMTEAP